MKISLPCAYTLPLFAKMVTSATAYTPVMKPQDSAKLINPLSTAPITMHAPSTLASPPQDYAHIPPRIVMIPTHVLWVTRVIQLLGVSFSLP